MGLILLWHVSSILCLAFYLVEWEPCEALGMLAVCITSSVIEGQHVGYRRLAKMQARDQAGKSIATPRQPGRDSSVQSLASSVHALDTSESGVQALDTSSSHVQLPNDTAAVTLRAPFHPWHIIGAVFAAGVVATSAAVFLLVLLLQAEPELGAPISAAASILLGVGFFPQYYEFLCTWSTHGYSFGVTAFDLVGCGANCLAAVASAHGKFDVRLINIMAPFLTIIVCHFGLIALAVMIAMTKPSVKVEGRHISLEDGLGVQPDAATKNTPLLSGPCKSEK